MRGGLLVAFAIALGCSSQPRPARVEDRSASTRAEKLVAAPRPSAPSRAPSQDVAQPAVVEEEPAPSNRSQGLPAAGIRRVVQAGIPSLRDCFDTDHDIDHMPDERLRVRVQIDPDGSVRNATLNPPSDVWFADGPPCVRQRVLTWRFPPARRPSETEFRVFPAPAP